MEIIKSGSFRRIYIGLIINFVCDLLRIGFGGGVLITLFLTGTMGIGIATQLIDALLTVGLVGSVLMIISGITDFRHILYMRRARAWFFVHLAFFVTYIFVDTVLVYLNNRLIGTAWVDNISPYIGIIINVIDVMVFLWLDVMADWNLLIGLGEIFRRCGEEDKVFQKPFNLAKQLLIASASLATVITALIIIGRIGKTSLYMLGDMVSVSSNIAGVVLVVFLVLIGIFYVWKLIVELQIIHTARKTYLVVTNLTR